MPRSRDTTPDAEAKQFELYRRMSGAQRTQLGEQMSMDAREMARAGIRSRHPEYDEATVRWALFRMLVGEELFRRAWPNAPVVAP